MRLQAFPISASRLTLGAFLVSPERSVVAWAGAFTYATCSSDAIVRVASGLLGYLALGFPASIAHTPSLAKHEQPPTSSFSASRLVASLRLADERLASDLLEWVGAIQVERVHIGAVFVEGSTAHYVSAGDAGGLWHVRANHLSWISRSGGASESAGSHEGRCKRPTLVPRVETFEVASGDVFGIGIWPADQLEPPAGDFSDWLAENIARSVSTGVPQGVVARLRE